MENNVQLLVDALRSGEFTQAIGALRRGDGHCCLGVACEVYRRRTGLGEWFLDPINGWTFKTGRFSGNPAFMPDPVYEWFGFPINNPNLLTRDGIVQSATILNDDEVQRYSFADIADAFERTFITNSVVTPPPAEESKEKGDKK